MRSETAAEKTEAGLEYRIMNREVRRKMKAAKEEWIEKQYKNVE